MLALIAALLVALAASQNTADPGVAVELFNGRDLTGWKPLGDALWSVEDGELVGAVGGGSQSFLVTDRSFGDFRLELDVKTELRGNSGIQIRSHVRDTGRVFGYQIEIDPSERAWSGGLYDEARRGWLQDLAGRDEARAAFRHGEWNRYAIECRGPWIRTWINGVPITDYLDPLDAEGFVALQVHSGDNTRVRWRDFVMTDLGQHAWRSVEALIQEGDPGWVARDGGVEHEALPADFTARWNWDVAAQVAVLRMGGDVLGCARDTVFVLPRQPHCGGLEILAEDLAPRAPDEPHTLAICRAGQRLRVLVDGALLWSQDDFDPAPGAGISLCIEGLPEPTAALELLVPRH